MRRLGLLVLILGIAAAVPVAFSQESEVAREAAESPSEGEHGSVELWKWANFLVLAGALGYLIGKNAPAFFDARSRKIRKDMIEAGDTRKEAEARVAEVEGRLANLEAEIAALRNESQDEARAETERMERQMAAEIAKIQAHAEQEIEAAGKAARSELKRYSAGLAVGLAERKIRSRMMPADQQALVDGFVRDLENPSAKAQIT